MKTVLLDIWDSMKDLLYSAGIVVMFAIVAGGCICFVLTRFDPNIVTIMYVENARDAGIARGTFINGILSGSGYTAMTLSYDAEVIEQWMELTEEAVSEENATELRTYSAVFPCYIVVFKELSEDTKGRLQRYYLISEKEVAFSEVTLFKGNRIKRIEYVSENPFYHQAAELMEAMGES